MFKFTPSSKVFVLSAAVCVFLILPAARCGAQQAHTNDSSSHFSGEAPGEKQAILRQVKGTVSAIDSPKMTLTIKTAEGEHTFKVNSKTRFTRNAQSASISDVAVGQPVEVVVKMVYGQPDETAEVDIKTR
jgi:hypothetical protein